MNPSQKKQLLKQIIIRVFLAIIVLGLLFFLPADTFNYWHAWVYVGTLFIPVTFVIVYFFKHDPELLKRRMKIKEKEKPQKIIILLSIIFFVAAFIIPGLDFRFNWSAVPVAVVILADIIILASYVLFFFVLQNNSYASRIIEVEKGQKVISTGPYKIVRHPLYVAAILICCFSPLALGSYWAMIAIIPLPFLIILMILNEEKMLIKELPGYKEYTQKTKYRLIPYIW